MKVILPDNVVSHMAASGFEREDVQAAHMAISFPASERTLPNGHTRFDGYGASVWGRKDRTGKFFKVSRIMVDKRD